MTRSFSKRRKFILLTILSALLFLAISITIFWIVFKPKPVYRPGEEIEGLKSDLSRSLPVGYPDVKFVDATSSSGIKFKHFSGERSSQLPEDMGSGAAWGDYNNDGWLDLFVVNMTGPLTMTDEEMQNSNAYSTLYKNNKDGTFTDVSKEAGVDFRGWGLAAAWGDYDNDGWLDLFLTTYGHNVLFRNNGDGTFTDLTDQTGLGGIHGFWAGCSWADFNLDGHLDLYVCGYVKYTPLDSKAFTTQYAVEVPVSINPSSFPPTGNLLYRNNGDGTFEEIAEQAGVNNTNGRSLSAAWCDFDTDGFPDLYVANDISDNALFRNLGNEKFEDISHAAWVADYRGAMGIAVGDWDGDLDFDIFVTHWLAQENALYSNLFSQYEALENTPAISAKFIDEADRFGLGQIALDYIGWGTSFFDYDNDMTQDLFVANGSTLPTPENPALLKPMNYLLFWNKNKDEGFYDVSEAGGEIFQQKFAGRGAAFGDYDNDGDIDIFVVNMQEPARLLRNEGGNKNHWLKINLEGKRSNHFGIGSNIKISAGGIQQIKQIGSQASYCSQNSITAHFGLKASETVDSLVVLWPSRIKQVFYDIPSNQTVEIVEGENDLRQAQ